MNASVRHIGFPGSIRVINGFGSGGAADSAAYTNFIARTSGLDATHLAAYKGLLDGLTTDGLFNSDGTTSYFDLLFIFATQDSTTSLLSLVNGTFSASANLITITADRGYTGNGSNAYISTNYNAATASSPKYTQNSGHMSAWNLSNISDSSPIFGIPTGDQNIYPKFTADSKIYARINDLSGGFAMTDPRGHLLGNRSSSTARQVYQNAASAGTYGSEASSAVGSANVTILFDGSVYSSYQVAMFSAGASLNSTLVTSFYGRLRTYMTAVGVP